MSAPDQSAPIPPKTEEVELEDHSTITNEHERTVIQDEEKGHTAVPDTLTKDELPPWHPTNNPDGGFDAWVTVAGSFCCK